MLVIEMLIVSRQGLAGGPAVPRCLNERLYLGSLPAGLLSLHCVARSHRTELSLYRLLVEGMVMPALFGLYAIRYFPVIEDLRKLHICACILASGSLYHGAF